MAEHLPNFYSGKVYLLKTESEFNEAKLTVNRNVTFTRDTAPPIRIFPQNIVNEPSKRADT